MNLRVYLVPFFLSSGLCSKAVDTPKESVSQNAAVNIIEGRVLNGDNGDYLRNVRITVEHTNLEVYSDSDGFYRVVGAPSGNARLTYSYTGLTTSTEIVNTAGGGTVIRDIKLSSAPASAERSGARAAEADTITLSAFRITATKETEGAAIAINEQRYARNVTLVASSDEFGFIPDGNLGEFIKFMPGVTVNYTGGEGRSISLNGVPADYTPIQVGGFALASAQSSGTGRTVELEQFSTNNVARVEINFSGTPDGPGGALGGWVNMVPRSAFERSKSELKVDAYLNWKRGYPDFNRTPGPMFETTRKIRPGFSFNYVNPVSNRFGFTLSGATSVQFSPQDFVQIGTRGTSTASGGTFIATTPDKPYVTNVIVRSGMKDTQRTSVAATMDFKASPTDRLSFSFQYAFFDAEFANRFLNVNSGGMLAGAFGSTFSHGTAGLGSIDSAGNSARNKSGTTIMPSLVWRHNGAVWDFEAGVATSQATNHYRDTDKGYLNPLVRRTNVTVNFDDYSYLHPQKITVLDSSGALVDYRNLNSYAISSASTNPLESRDVKNSAYGFVSRDFFGVAPFKIKAGFDLTQSIRDIRGANYSYSFVGPTNVSTTDAANPAFQANNASQLLDARFSSGSMPFGFGQVQVPDFTKLEKLLQLHPEWFSVTPNTVYRAYVTQSKLAKEGIYAEYIRGDLSLFHNRLKLVGGARVETTKDDGAGPLSDPTLNYLKDAAGKIVNDAAGKPVSIVPTSNALGVSQLTFLDRAKHSKTDYTTVLPSLNGTYTILENLQLRAAYYESIGRPSFDQYAGALTLPDLSSSPSTTNVITVNNAEIKPWHARSGILRLEYYFGRVGSLTIGATRRRIDHFFSTTTFAATDSFLSSFDLDPSTYSGYLVSSQTNLTTPVFINSYDISYKQALTFLPQWARGIQVFANFSRQILHAPETVAANLAGVVPMSGSAGISLSRSRFSASANWNVRSRQRRTLFTGESIGPSTYSWGTPRRYVDVNLSYKFAKRWSVYGSARNLTDSPDTFEIYGPSTPAINRLRDNEDFHTTFYFGVNGTL